jgi:hypothetical protein
MHPGACTARKFFYRREVAPTAVISVSQRALPRERTRSRLKCSARHVGVAGKSTSSSPRLRIDLADGVARAAATAAAG